MVVAILLIMTNLVSFFFLKMMETNQTNMKNKFRQGAHRPD
jgi:hypothetical protein